jgi:hypothetical protein
MREIGVHGDDPIERSVEHVAKPCAIRAAKTAFVLAIYVDDPPFTNMGRYPIVPFLVSGIGTVFGANDLSAFASRLALGLACIILLGIAVSSISQRRQSLLPVMLAVTPGVVFLSAVMNPSGLEICAAIALWTTAPHVLRKTPLQKFENLGFAVSGVMLIAARPLGPLLYSCILLGCFMHMGTRCDVRQIIASCKAVWSVHISAMMFSVGWYMRVFSVNTSDSVTAGSPSLGLGQQIVEALQHVPDVVSQAVGNFGWLDTSMPRNAWLLRM